MIWRFIKQLFCDHRYYAAVGDGYVIWTCSRCGRHEVRRD